MFQLHKKIIELFINTDIKDINTYGGYKGDYILKITTKHLSLAESIASHCENLGGKSVIKENKNLMNYEIYCIAEDPDVYHIKIR